MQKKKYSQEAGALQIMQSLCHDDSCPYIERGVARFVYDVLFKAIHQRATTNLPDADLRHNKKAAMAALNCFHRFTGIDWWGGYVAQGLPIIVLFSFRVLSELSF